MNSKNHKKYAQLIISSEDPGGELIKLLEELDAIDYEKIPILITQAVIPEGNPQIHITVLSNKQTDFPLATDELYVKWVRDLADKLESNKVEQ